jgi:16S rRNA (guanine527-N7)-methyltransferase
MDTSTGSRWTPEEGRLLGAWCASLKIKLDERLRRQLATYRILLLDWNRRMNLTTIDEPGQILVKHFLDSLTVVPHLPCGAGKVVDVGSGAGFPGLVLAILRSDLEVTLVEARAKKVGFLEHVRRTLGLVRCQILHHHLGRAGNSPLRGNFEVGVFRAVRSLPTMLELIRPQVCSQGRAIAMLGRTTAPIEAVMEKSACGLGWELLSVQRYTLPQDAGVRHLALFRRGEASCST